MVLIPLSSIIKHVGLAKYFEKLVRADDRFEVIGEVLMGLVCFKLKVSLKYLEYLPWFRSHDEPFKSC